MKLNVRVFAFATSIVTAVAFSICALFVALATANAAKGTDD